MRVAALTKEGIKAGHNVRFHRRMGASIHGGGDAERVELDLLYAERGLAPTPHRIRLACINAGGNLAGSTYNCVDVLQCRSEVAQPAPHIEESVTWS